jgi:hypothetical protein
MERPNESNKNANPPKTLKYKKKKLYSEKKIFFYNSSYRCTIINITGFSSPHKDDVIDTNDRCDPTMSTYVEFSDCGGAVLEEQPAKTAEAIRLFLQGLGHRMSLNFFY